MHTYRLLAASCESTRFVLDQCLSSARSSVTFRYHPQVWTQIVEIEIGENIAQDFVDRIIERNAEVFEKWFDGVYGSIHFPPLILFADQDNSGLIEQVASRLKASEGLSLGEDLDDNLILLRDFARCIQKDGEHLLTAA